MSSLIPVRLHKKLKASAMEWTQSSRPSRMQHPSASKSRFNGQNDRGRRMEIHDWKRKISVESMEHRDAVAEIVSERLSYAETPKESSASFVC